MAGYQYGGSGKSMSEQEVAARITNARATAAARGDSAPTPAAGRDLTPPQPPKQLKGATKVTEFPSRSPYPFAEIAADGGIWELDPAAFASRGKTPQPQSIRTAASKWAIDHGLTAKTVLSGGYIYVQFKAGA